MARRLGRYELLRPIGRGGMGMVFLARQRGPGGFEKLLAIKRILPALARDPRFLRLFFEEARLHASLVHGNLVPIFDFGRVGNDFFLAMEYIHGCDLTSLLATASEGLGPQDTGYLGGELCRALAHVHRHGLVHRDVTPRNVLLSLDGEVKLTDFGVARDPRHADGIRGTIAYMAPEQARGEPVDARADLYALGLILAEAVTGSRIRKSDAADDALREAAEAEPVTIEGPFAEVVARATARRAEDRYANADAMAEAIESVNARLGSSRATSARGLAARVRDRADRRTEASEELPPSSSLHAPATYYRDAVTDVSLIDELVAPKPSRVPRFALLTALAIGLVGLAFWRRAPTRERAPVAQRTTARPAPSPPPVPTPAPVERKASPISPAEPQGMGSLRVLCEPWCIVSIDGRRRGDDDRDHSLRLTAGRHRIDAKRLDDVQSRIVTVSADRTATVEFTFD